MNSTDILRLLRATSAAVAILSASLFLSSCQKSQDKSAENAGQSKTAQSNPVSEQADGKSNHAPDSTIVPVVAVTSTILQKPVKLPAELEPFRDVKVRAKVKGFINWIGVDRGSIVKSGQCLIKLTAPELDAQCDEARAKQVEAKAAHAEAMSVVEQDRASHVEVQAKLDADRLLLERLRKADREPGAIAQNEVDAAAKAVEGDEARLKAAQSKVEAAKSEADAKLQAITAATNSLKSLEQMRAYLIVRAPIDGVITERFVHEGDIAGVSGGRNETEHPLLRLEETSRLRLVVSVPEQLCSGIAAGDVLAFSVPAYLGREFHGTVSRIGHALDQETRTMPVELDVNNASGELEPGMYATVTWEVRRNRPTLFVPISAVVNTLEKSFVVRVKNGIAEVVEVSTGQTMNDKVEVVGNIKEGDEIVLKGSDEYKDGSHMATRIASAQDLEAAGKKKAAAGE
jgi:RND family efflux transporter MFP subunit